MNCVIFKQSTQDNTEHRPPQRVWRLAVYGFEICVPTHIFLQLQDPSAVHSLLCLKSFRLGRQWRDRTARKSFLNTLVPLGQEHLPTPVWKPRDIHLSYTGEKPLGQDREAPICSHYYFFFLLQDKILFHFHIFILSLPEKDESLTSLWSPCFPGQFGRWSNAGVYVGTKPGKALKAQDQYGIPNWCEGWCADTTMECQVPNTLALSIVKHFYGISLRTSYTSRFHGDPLMFSWRPQNSFPIPSRKM